MTNDNYQNTEEEIQELERHLKTLKQQSREGRGDRYILPTSILIAALLISGAFIYSQGKSVSSQQASLRNAVPQQAPPPNFGGASLDNVRPVSSEDHINGNPNAPVKIVEYSDFECPFCKRFHTTMNQVMDEYGKNGQVAWVYRHFPLDQLHPIKARREAVASECVNEIGGNNAFWQFASRFFELTPSNNQTDIDTVLPQIAQEIGIDKDRFQSCLESGRYDDHIQDDIDNAVATGGRGTPWSIIIAENGQTFPLSGAQPYQLVKQLIDLALRE